MNEIQIKNKVTNEGTNASKMYNACTQNKINYF